MSEVNCVSEPCPLFLNSTCVFYTGESLLYIGVQTNDNLEIVIEKINQAFQNAGIGYAFTNGLIQPTPFQPVQLGGALIQNTTIGGNFTLTFSGNVQAARHITTGGSSSQFVKGDGTLDPTAYQPAANYITGLSGDATASGPGVAAMTLATVNFASGTFGNGNTIPIVTVNAKGLVTNITPTPINLPPISLTFIGDVVGSGLTGSNITLLLQNVNANPYTTITPLKFTVNGKGLVTSASPITASDIVNILGYNPGTSGTSGSTGTSGTSGTTGTSGTSGTSATSGTSGTTGTSGTSATSGTSGTSGTDGTGGTSGTSGSTGTSGTAGTSGTSATSGTSGTTGSSGTSGTSGSTGTSGSSGTTGTSGSSGTTGTSGSSGTSGTTGTSGTSGTSGSTGTSGSSGLSGDRFKTTSTTTYTLQAPGNPGTLTVDPGLAYTVAQSIIIAYDANNHNEAEVTSYNSITGVINFVTFTLTGSGTYSSWFVNIDGASGGDGSSGSSGTSGTSATAGTSGTTGTSGSSGTSGTTGTSGSSGTSGTSATDGTGGTSGTSGSSATSGTTGTSGTSATSGTSGTSATSGTTGTSGTSGGTGTGGTSGTSGSSATSGTSGTSGVNGAPGAGGTSGTSGTSVAVSGTTNTLAKFTSATTIGNSTITDDGSNVTVSSNLYSGLLIAQGPGGNYNENVRLPGATAVISFNTTGTTGAGSYNIVSQTDFQIRNSGGSQVFVMDQSGNLTMSGSMRAPIFYDSNNTNYYVDPAGTTSLRTVGSWRADSAAWDGEFNGKIQYHSNSWYFQAAGSWLFRNSGGSNIFTVDQSGTVVASGNITGGYILGTYFNASSGNSENPTIGQIWTQNTSDNYLRKSTPAHFRSQITDGVYVPIRSQSNWNDATVINNVVGMLAWKNYGNGHVIFDASQSTSPSGGGVSSTNATNAWTATFPTLMGWNGSQTYGVRVDSARVADSSGSASSVPWTGVSAGIRENYDLQFRPADNSSSYGGFAFASPGNTSNAGYFLVRGGADNDVYTQNGLTIVADLGWLTLAQRTTASRGVRIMTGVTSVTRASFATDGSINFTGDPIASSSFRAPIFYDSNDTTYYLDPNSTGLSLSSNGIVSSGGGTAGGFQNRVYVGGRNRIWSFGNADAYGISYFQGPDYIGLHFGTATQAASQFWVSDSGISQTSASSRAPIFYDSQDTTYYLDPNSTVSAVFRGSIGLNNTSPINSAWGNGSTTTQLSIYGSAYGVINLRGDAGSARTFSMGVGDNRFYMCYDNTAGRHNIIVNSSGSVSADVDFRAPIFYDSNNTGYYLDPASGSYLNGVSTTNYLTASNCNLAVTGIAGQITLTTSTGFGGYFRATEHIVIENTTAGYHVYVIGSNGVGVVKYYNDQFWSAQSDGRIKTVHSTLKNNLSKLENINPIYYSFNNFDDDKNRIGLIAQEVQEHFPELVNIDPKTDYLTVNYTGLIPVLLGAIKELKNKVETLETKIQ